MARVDVIVPLYNKGKYIRRTLNSILAQTWGDFEVIVVDDGSTDDGPAVVSACSDGRIRLIRQANQGPGAARNHGIRLSNAPYLTFLDADDEWLPDFLERAIGALDDHKGSSVFVANHFRGADSDTYLRYHPDLPLGPGNGTLPADIPPEMVKACVDLFAQGAMLIDRKVVDHLGGYLEDRCTYGEDAFLWLRVLLHYPLYVCKEPLLRVHLDSSVLGAKRTTPYPVHALVERATAVLADCPERYRELIKAVLDYYALISLRRRLDCRDYVSAQRIMGCFPLSRQYRAQFLKVRIKSGLLAYIPIRRIPYRAKHQEHHPGGHPAPVSGTASHAGQ